MLASLERVGARASVAGVEAVAHAVRALVLRIRGREQPVVVNALVRRENGVFRLRGERAINLRTYGIDPPTRFLGLVRVDEVVTVHFDVAVRPLVDPLGMVTSSLH